MGVVDTTYGGGRLRGLALIGLLTAIGVVLAVDLLLKLIGLSVFLGGVQVLGGRLAVASLVSDVVDGLIVGLAIGLAGVGLSMTYSILNFANFAHGDTVTAGAFVGWVASYAVAGLAAGVGASEFGDVLLLETSLGVNVLADPLVVIVGLVVSAVGTVGLVLLIDRLVYRPMRDAGSISLLIASIGVALALRYLIAFVFGQSTEGVANTGAGIGLANPFGGGALFNVTDHEATLLVAAGALMVGVHLLLQRTKLGTAMRAMADNEDLARVTGIPTERVVRLTWIVGAALAGVAGYLLVLESGTIAFNFGWRLLLLIFAAVILGGIGSVYGAMAGGVIIGVVENVSQVWLPSDLSQAAAFVALIVVLLVRPEGLFGGVKTA